MANPKLIFSEDGIIETIYNYVLLIEEEEPSNHIEKYEEDVEDAYAYMNIEDIKKLEAEKKKLKNISKSKIHKKPHLDSNFYGLPK
ncbi:hypothetical protein [Clostridium sp.]|uniref:hypothetical protein n=1 Tax=Clostridium sp. TaxID=1506 RepID=UPI00321745E9